MTPDPAESEVCGNQGPRQGPHHLCLGVPAAFTPHTQTCAGLSISGSLATACEASETPGKPGPPFPEHRPHSGVHAGGTRLTSQKVEGRAMGPPRGLHSPHPDDAPGGQSNRPAGIWVAGAPGPHRPVSGTREPGGGGGGRPGLGARPVRWSGRTHTGGHGPPHVHSTQHGRELRSGRLSRRGACICSVPKCSRRYSGSSRPALGA